MSSYISLKKAFAERKADEELRKYHSKSRLFYIIVEANLRLFWKLHFQSCSKRNHIWNQNLICMRCGVNKYELDNPEHYEILQLIREIKRLKRLIYYKQLKTFK